MTTEKVESATSGEYFIKEEVNFENTEATTSELDIENYQCLQTGLRKCGEVFRTTDEKFIFLCTECNRSFMCVRTYLVHLRDQNCESKLNISTRDFRDANQIPHRQSTTMNVKMEHADEHEVDMHGHIEVLKDTEIKSETALICCKLDDIRKPDSATKLTENLNACIQSPIGFQSNEYLKVEVNSDSDGEDIMETDSCKTNTKSRVGNENQTQEPQMPVDMPICVACSRVYSNSGSFRKHLHKKHSDMLSLEVMKFGSIDYLENEIRKSLEAMICVYCFKQYDSIDEFRQHGVGHVGALVFHCKFCPKTFGSRFKREFHMNTHQDIRPYTCSYCSKSFAHRPNHRRHEKLHSNIRTFLCNYCDKKFKTGYDRTAHLRTHTKELPYPCQKCGQRFLTPSDLDDHKLRHKGVKNFKCLKCRRPFYTKTLLTNHMESYGHT